MSLFSRIANVFRGDRLANDINDEFESHIASAIAEGRDPAEARRAFGPMLRHREQTRDTRIIHWLDGLRADVVFGWRQLRRNRVTFLAAILSLALAMGACVAAFRLIDALLLTPLPITNPSNLYAVEYVGFTFQGVPNQWDTTSWPILQVMRDAVKSNAELIAIEPASRSDLTFSTDNDIEKARVEHISGNMFTSFGIQPALGRLFTPDFDRTLAANPYAVISYSYWSSRLGRDPNVIGRTFRMGNTMFQIIGVSQKSFIGTEPGIIPDIFIPTMMMSHDLYTNGGDGWLRIFASPAPGVSLDTVRQQMYSAYRTEEIERSKAWVNTIPKEMMVGFPREKIQLNPAGNGVSGMQTEYRTALTALGILVALVLLIACVNVANLMSVLAAVRSREMALRVSIGAGRARLIQMVLVESAQIALAAASLGAIFAWWSAPLVVRLINPSDDPAQLVLPADWRVLAFAAGLIAAVTLLFGLVPALRASAVKPVHALKGGDDPHARRRVMRGMVALQVAFCFLVVFVGGLFVAGFNRLTHAPIGFNPNNLLLLDTVTKTPQPAITWDQLADSLRATPGIQSVALTGWPLLSGGTDNNLISADGATPTHVVARDLPVSPNFLATMQIPLLDGRDFRDSDISGQVAIVTLQFAKQFFAGANPVGRYFQTTTSKNRTQIIGLADNAAYVDVHDPMLPIFFAPIHSPLATDTTGALHPISNATFIVRTTGDPALLAATLRQQVQHLQPEFRVSNITTQSELILDQTLRERLLAMLGTFFSAVALLLAAIGLYGVLNYGVIQRRREIGIRLAVGARATDITHLVSLDIIAMVALGAAIGIAAGLSLSRYAKTYATVLLYQVKPADALMLAIPIAAIAAVTIAALLPAIRRALRIDPAEILRSE
jgi:putative ABC transport system permease protein